MTPAIWAAGAATISAILAFLALMVNRQNLLDASRPDLILEGWRRSVAATDFERIHIARIRNVGKGVALHVEIGATAYTSDHNVTALMTGFDIPILAPGESAEIPRTLDLYWNFVPILKEDDAYFGPSEGRYQSVPIEVVCWDARGQRHVTTYQTYVADSHSPAMFRNMLIDGLAIDSRKIVVTPGWRLKIGAAAVGWGRKAVGLRFRLKSIISRRRRVAGEQQLGDPSPPKLHSSEPPEP